MSATLSSQDWFGKASAATILGFLLALGGSGVLAWGLGISDTYVSTRGQLTMWFIAPAWSILLSVCFLFRSGRRAWAWLGLANVVVWLLLFAGGRL